jgi:hypothetical protein
MAAKGIPAVVQTIFVLTQQLAILTEEEKITRRLINETVRTNQHIIKEMLGEARMKQPHPIRPVSDLADLDRIYEAPDDLSDRFTEEEIESDDINGFPAETKPVGDNGDAASRKQNKANTIIKAANRTALAKATNKLNHKSDQRRKELSKDDVRNSANRKGGKTRRGSTRKKDKYSRSPEDYLKGK